MLGSTKLNSYAAAPAKAGEYTFVFKNGTINSAATGYSSIDNLKDTSVYMMVPGNSDVVFEDMTFNGVVSFDIQMYTSPWSYLHSITFKNCTFNGIIVGSCPAETPIRPMPITPTPSGGVQAPATGVPAQMRVFTP